MYHTFSIDKNHSRSNMPHFLYKKNYRFPFICRDFLLHHDIYFADMKTPLILLLCSINCFSFSQSFIQLSLTSYLRPTAWFPYLSASLGTSNMLLAMNIRNHVGFEVFTAVMMKNAILWDMVPCGVIINRCFGGTCHLRLQGRRNNVNV
jgi:hypothetical protein